MRPTSLLVLGAVSSFLLRSASAGSVDVSVRAPWSSGPTASLLEASEFVSDEDPQGGLFWQYVTESTRLLRAAAAEGGADAARALASSPTFPLLLARPFLAPITLDVLSVSLGARAASAAVESHASLARASIGARECGAEARSWADVFSTEGSVAVAACSAADLDSALTRAGAAAKESANASSSRLAAARIFSWDHSFSADAATAAAAANAPVVIVYADLGDVGAGGDAGALVDGVTRAVGISRARAVYRHAPAPAREGEDATTWLAGFGVALDIKSTEYKVVDERSSSGGSSAVAVDADGTASVIPETVVALRALDEWAVKEAAVNSSGSGVDWSTLDSLTPVVADVALTPSQCADLGLQAAAFVMDAAARAAAGEVGEAADPLAALVRVTGNFPALAPWLSTLPVPPALRAEAAYNTRFAPPGTATMTLNGIVVEASDNYFNLFSLFNTLRAEARTVAMLDTLPLSHADRSRVLSLAFKDGNKGSAAGGGRGEQSGGAPSKDDAADRDEGDDSAGAPTLRLNMLFDESPFAKLSASAAPWTASTVDPAFWLNDVEKDPMYSRFPDELTTLLTPSWQLHNLRRNIYNGLVVLEAASGAGMMALHSVVSYVGMRVPIRLGVALLPGNSADEVAALAAATAHDAPALTVNTSAPVSSLQLALLATAAGATRNASVSAAFVRALTERWATAAQEAAQAAMDAGDTSGAQQTEPAAPTVEDAIAAYSTAAAPAPALSGASRMMMNAMAHPAVGGSAEATLEAHAALADEGGALRRVITAGAVAWVASLGVPTPCIIFNGRVIPGLSLQQELMTSVQADLQLLQTAVGTRAIDDSVSPSVLHALLGRASRLTGASGKAARGSKSAATTAVAVTAAAGEAGTLSLPGAGVPVGRYHSAVFAPDDAQVFLPLAAPEAAPLLAAAAYVHAPGTSDAVKPVSVLLVDDLSTPHGLASAAALLATGVSFEDDATGVGASCAAAAPAAPQQLPRTLCLPRLDKAAADRAARLLRIGLLHVSPITGGGADGTAVADTMTQAATVGDVVAFAAALVAGSGRNRAIVDVWPDEAAPTLAAIVDFARSAVAAGRTDGADLAARISRWLRDDAPASPFPLRARAAARLGGALADAFAGVSEVDASVAAARSSSTSTLAAGAAVAREMLPATLPSTRSTDALDGKVRVRGILVNGRILSLRGSGGSAGDLGASSCGARDTQASSGATGDLAALGLCLTVEEVALLGTAERAARGGAVARLLSGVSFPPQYLPDGDPDALTADWISGVVAAAASAVGASSRIAKAGGSGRISMRTALLEANYTSFSSARAGDSGGDAGTSSVGLAVVAIVDPASVDAQKTAPLLKLLRDSLGARVTVYLVPPSAPLTDLPVRSFFRYVLPGGGGPTAHHPRGVFAWLPPSALLTLKLAVPEPWNVQVSRATADCDNLRVGADVHVPAEYVVKDLLVAGSCVDSTRGGAAYPNGLQLALSPMGATEDADAIHDTLVMNNLGYWQLRTQPGLWDVRLATGRSAELFTILEQTGGVSAFGPSRRSSMFGFFGGARGGGGDSAPASALTVAVRDFTGPFSQLRVRKREGRESEQLLALSAVSSGNVAGSGDLTTTAPTPSLLGALSRSFFGAGGSPGGGKDGAALDRPLVHVFSIASGHLYERFLKIMMLAAIRRSPSVRLKFWLVENFLSPAFKASAPALAAANGAEVEFVTYKWPNWLRAQTEKQRIIWGYKILFLDVLFPLDVKRIIYIDADQIVRSDLRELAELDLGGAPYAFTPFCESRKETLGYQFWREGFWKDHLRGRPYHISALFVVDLALFRRTAAGDNLRAVYEQLSRDPNSLANLDQDLPNFAQLQIPIHSLPQEWLWCESWCSDASKSASKTIDLCNNPRYKEPKLNMARRVINGSLFPESWDELDAEASKF